MVLLLEETIRVIELHDSFVESPEISFLLFSFCNRCPGREFLFDLLFKLAVRLGLGPFSTQNLLASMNL